MLFVHFVFASSPLIPKSAMSEPGGVVVDVSVGQHRFAHLQMKAVDDVDDVVRKVAAQQCGRFANAGVEHGQRHLRPLSFRILIDAHEGDVVGITAGCRQSAGLCRLEW